MFFSGAWSMLIRTFCCPRFFLCPQQILKTGLYKITAYGAQGGNAYEGNPSYPGGKGAIAMGVFSLSEGDKLNVVVGTVQQRQPC